VVHAYNPSYSGGKDQEDHSLKPALANSLWDPVSKKPWVAQGEGPEFNPQYCKKKKKKKKKKSHKWKEYLRVGLYNLCKGRAIIVPNGKLEKQ
jgi:hypothetical protein